jgi:signal transduction histidine kinase
MFGIDIAQNDFYSIIRATLLPLVLLAILLLLLLTMQTVALVRIWKNRLQLVEETDRQKDELLGLVSHQLAAPVTSMKWYLEMLAGGDLGVLQKDQQESIATMQGIATNLADLVSMILDVSRIQLGRVKIDASVMDLGELITEIIATVQPKIEEKKISFINDVPADIPKMLLDKKYTRMTIENLLSNAVKYCSVHGKVRLTVKAQNNSLYCEVEDSGCGIPEKDKDQIFSKLFRASNVRNTVDGNGFGLYVAKGAIEAQGGKIWFESEEGKGTIFKFTLPMNPLR